ncbi:MAG: GIY-YIG nuclease family protein [Actinomycetota bacterium]
MTESPDSCNMLLLMNRFFVYIMTTEYKTVLYTGVTKHLKQRVFEHRGSRRGFTAKYNTSRLVYYRGFETIEAAINEEKRIKGGSRSAKDKLINDTNPTWQDLTNNLKQ